MSRLSELLATRPKTPLDAVVWAGAGYGADLGVIRGLPAGRRIYLEPHPGLGAKLAGACSHDRDETALPLALWRTSGQRAFHTLSNPLKGSLLPPDGVVERMPNLTRAAPHPVETICLDDLVTRFELGSHRNSLLVMDVAGAEMDVLAGASRPAIGAFSAIVLCEAAAGDYTGASPLEETTAYLSQLGYVEAVAPTGEVKSGRIAMMLRDDAVWGREARMNELQTKALALKSEVQDLTARLEAQREEIQGLRVHAHELGTARDQQAQLASDAMAELEDLRRQVSELGEARDQQSQLAMESQKEIEVLVAQVQAQAETIAGLRVHATELGQARDQHAGWLHERDQQLAELQGRLQSQAEQSEALAQQVSKLGGARDQQAQLGLERQQRIDALMVELTAKAEEVEGLRRHASDLGMARDEQARLVAELRQEAAARSGDLGKLEQELGAARQQVERLEAGRADHEAQLQQARQAATLSLKLQMLREADLKELQERYKASLAVQERQHQMLAKLGERMGVASRYFHQLAASETGAASAVDRSPPAAGEAGMPALAVTLDGRGRATKKGSGVRVATAKQRAPRRKG